MPVVWPTLLDLSRDECKRILRKLELEAYAGVISALRAQGDLTKEKKDLLGELSKVLSISTERHRAEVRRAVNDERLTTIAHKMNLSLYLGERPSYSMSGPNSSSEWSIEGRRLVPLMPRLVPQTAFTVTANAVANAAIQHNASLPVPAETGSKEGVSCSDEDEKPRKRRRTNSSSSSPVVLKEVPKAVVPVSKTITVPVSGSPKMSNIMQSIANSLPPHMSPVKITFTKPSTQTTNTTTQKVIIVTTSPSSTFVPNILSKSHNYAAVTKLVPTSVIASTTQKPPVVITASQSSLVSNSSSGSSSSTPSPIPNTVAVTAVVSSTPSVVMSTVAQGVSTSAIKMASTRLPSPKSLVSAPTQILAQFPKQHQQSPKQQLYQVQQQTQQQVAQPSPVSHQQQPQQSPLPPGIKPTIQIKQESGVKIITQQVQPSKILPKPVTATLPTSSNSPIMVVSSNGAIMTTKLVTTPTGTQATYTRPTVSPSIGRMAATPGAATYVKTTSGSIITVVPKSLATLGGKIISSNIVSGTTTKITTIPMTSKPNVIVVQKTTGKGTTIQGLPGKNVVTTLLNAGGEKTIQTVPTGAKPAILTATRPITKMIVTQPKGIGSTVQPAAKIIPTKIVYGQQGKTQVLIKPKPVTFQATVVSEQTRQLVTETLQQASRVAEAGNSSIQEGKEEPQNYTDSSSSSTESSQSSQDSQPVVHVIASRRQDWSEHEIAMETSPTIIYQDVSSESQSATSTIKALLELQQTTVKEKLESKPRQPTIDLSQMAVPIQMTQEKRHSPESPSIAVVESELVAEYITTERTDEGTEVAFPLLVSHRSQPQQPSQPQRTLLQHVAQSQTATQTSVVVKSIPASSPGAITHIMQQALSSHTAFTKHSEELGTEEGEVEEMDTLDPQTGLFYRSALTQSQSAKQQKLSQPPLEQTQLQVKTLQCFQTKQKQTIHLQADQLQHKLPQMPQLSIRHQKLTPLQQEQAQPKPDVQHTQHPMVAKDRQLPTLMAQPPQTVVQVLAVKTTQQLPKLQQAPNQPKIYVQPQTPQSQMSLPASSEKQTASQVEQPIITQGSSVTKITFEGRQPPTVTKITGGSSVPKLTSPVTSISPIQASEKTAVSDILKMSLMEAQIDTNVEHMIVDPPKKALATSMLTGEAGSLPSTHMVVAGMANSTPQQQKCRESCSSPSTVGSSLTTRKIDPPAVPATGQFMRIQNVGQKKAEESPAEIIIQAIPQYAIPCHSSSNVVVEPSGLLELNNFTSQQLDDEETAMEQDIDSSTEDGTEPSPSQSSAERS
ncbi:BRCA2-interacting transcriptional repressor EMSY isoform X8 [Nomascus leucogenys]|uniref:BRCA2-interacting transcriptional repressor EMSY isoform X10 n=1 Tax=Homo sapiens TaxID=9606 RepID=UPI000387B450|nr:BRCA2-interacting transcriptional repressor EMSY isoform X8 [Nomascus leucogenys]XP_047283232.1 BRCA2-interacting transcriptional repressor EMSY isoform X10 [Homo sapiens]XP_054225371.1 BRCA2-interacting transcriptional repressor EMSY isoform X10 [Homo sapiens]XP_054518525.1 BRCA2-interacting transcriptional repressor EMSY isoform X13 [Pan troglodytes]XP_054950678.1 BRCA2-interacting transcriptional repressor EMSY isoform X8 [Pan paniscus]XP_055138970.1 BRCA2-interacting transcriptional rep